MIKERIDTVRGHTVYAKGEYGKVSVGATFGMAGMWFELTADEARKLADQLVKSADSLQVKEEA